MILIKGSHIGFEMEDGHTIWLPKSYGIIHDPDGQDLKRCDVYFGPYKVTAGKADLTAAGKAYFGNDYQPDKVAVDLPQGTWNPIGEVVQIFYRRPAGQRVAKFTAKYHHPFKKVAKPTLLKSGDSSLKRGENFYKFDLPGFCIIDDRGFVFP